MYKKITNTAAALIISSSVLMTATSVKAATVNFSLGGFGPGGGGTVSGYFTGNTNTSGNIGIPNLTDFSVTSTNPSLTLGQGNLQSFSYFPSTGGLAFDALDRATGNEIILNNEVTGIVTLGGHDPVTSSSPVAVTGVPEPSEIGGMYLLGLVGLGGLMKRKVAF